MRTRRKTGTLRPSSLTSFRILGQEYVQRRGISVAVHVKTNSWEEELRRLNHPTGEDHRKLWKPLKRNKDFSLLFPKADKKALDGGTEQLISDFNSLDKIILKSLESFNKGTTFLVEIWIPESEGK